MITLISLSLKCKWKVLLKLFSFSPYASSSLNSQQLLDENEAAVGRGWGWGGLGGLPFSPPTHLLKPISKRKSFMKFCFLLAAFPT